MMDLDSVSSSVPREYIAMFTSIPPIALNPLVKTATKASTPMPSTPAEPVQPHPLKTITSLVTEQSELAPKKDAMGFLEAHKTEV